MLAPWSPGWSPSRPSWAAAAPVGRSGPRRTRPPGQRRPCTQAGLTEFTRMKTPKTVWLKCQIIKISEKQSSDSFYADPEQNIWIYNSERRRKKNSPYLWFRIRGLELIPDAHKELHITGMQCRSSKTELSTFNLLCCSHSGLNLDPDQEQIIIWFHPPEKKTNVNITGTRVDVFLSSTLTRDCK